MDLWPYKYKTSQKIIARDKHYSLISGKEKSFFNIDTSEEVSKLSKCYEQNKLERLLNRKYS